MQMLSPMGCRGAAQAMPARSSIFFQKRLIASERGFHHAIVGEFFSNCGAGGVAEAAGFLAIAQQALDANCEGVWVGLGHEEAVLLRRHNFWVLRRWRHR